ncbi:hypothetical protein GTPT_1581 [Tatumella ptyseos ATCC 33301]|uniref:Uncharacterized protein n=1 Tax=Tatumella ptyseos ATCC 33301 TaxID=1005995 RepID=A0A085JI30_9GAMM|nr:hypothetical protein GTPT_1581 [Tatumella ptyseos ATCC 33301]
MAESVEMQYRYAAYRIGQCAYSVQEFLCAQGGVAGRENTALC